MTQSFGLALGGGGARGYAHIGVIKYLTEKNITVDAIAGTSMGAIIGAMYAAGMTTHDMEDAIGALTYSKIIDINLTTGLMDGQKIYDWLEHLFGQMKIENLKKPLHIVACDLNTGTQKIFDSGLVIDAVRASISLPGILAPYALDNTLYVDGGLMNNLPVDVLPSKDVVAISVLGNHYETLETKTQFRGFSLPKNPVSVSSEILGRSIDIMIRRIEDFTLAQSDKHITLIRPDVGDYTTFDLYKLKDIVQIGYDAAKSIL